MLILTAEEPSIAAVSKENFSLLSQHDMEVFLALRADSQL